MTKQGLDVLFKDIQLLQMLQDPLDSIRRHENLPQVEGKGGKEQQFVHA